MSQVFNPLSGKKSGILESIGSDMHIFRQILDFTQIRAALKCGFVDFADTVRQYDLYKPCFIFESAPCNAIDSDSHDLFRNHHYAFDRAHAPGTDQFVYIIIRVYIFSIHTPKATRRIRNLLRETAPPHVHACLIVLIFQL